MDEYKKGFMCGVLATVLSITALDDDGGCKELADGSEAMQTGLVLYGEGREKS